MEALLFLEAFSEKRTALARDKLLSLELTYSRQAKPPPSPQEVMDSPFFRRAERLPKKWFSPSYLLQTHHLLTPPILLPYQGPSATTPLRYRRRTQEETAVCTLLWAQYFI